MLYYILGAFHRSRGKQFFINVFNNLIFKNNLFNNNVFNNYLIVTATILENTHALASLSSNGSSFVKGVLRLSQWVVPLTPSRETQT